MSSQPPSPASVFPTHTSTQHALGSATPPPRRFLGSQIDTSLSALGPDAAYVRSNVIAPNYPAFAKKLDTFTRGGARRCFFVADFDFTLSMPGGLTSWSILDSNPALPREFRDECLAMARKYFPIEASLTLTRDEKAPILTEWFTRFHSLVASQGLTPATVGAICADAMPHTTPTGLVDPAAAAATATATTTTNASAASPSSSAAAATPPPPCAGAAEGSSAAASLFPRLPLLTVPATSPHAACTRLPGVMTMRKHFHELFSELSAADVPTVVVSAGLGTFVIDALRRHGIPAPVPLVTETVDPLTRPQPLPGSRAVAAAAKAVPGLTLDPLLPLATTAAAAATAPAVAAAVAPTSAAAAAAPTSAAAPGTPPSAQKEPLPVYVSANFPAFSPSGCVASFLPQDPIHVYNKCDVAPLTVLERRLASARGLASDNGAAADTCSSSNSGSENGGRSGGQEEGFNVILVGDSLGDATIAGSLPAAAEVLTVGFLNLRPGVTARLAADGSARDELMHTCPAHSHSAHGHSAPGHHESADQQQQQGQKPTTERGCDGGSSPSSDVVAPDGCDVPSDKASEFNPAHPVEAPMSTEHARRAAAISGPSSCPTTTILASAAAPVPTTATAAAAAAAHQPTVAEAATSSIVGGHADCPACIAAVAAARLSKHCATFDLVIVDDGSLEVPLDIVRAIIKGGAVDTVAAKL